ncbi:MAG TPA: ChbG/HpnK family deacetylase [Pyrinomonadaceae bacterium]|nr:ChbG/HpnK family deacetylase [Pyrinomonadaceae bacterium]
MPDIKARFIFTADDFGLTRGVSDAIARVMSGGVVTSTSVLVCRDNHELITPWVGEISGRAGLHLQLTDGVPCLPPDEVPSLVTGSGRFPPRRADVRAVEPDEVWAEWLAQAEQFARFGMSPSHVDSHHSVHTLPQVLPVYARLALHLGLPARSGPPHVTGYLRGRGIECPDTCEDHWYSPEVTEARLLAFVSKNLALHGGGVVEFMCHPGCVDADLRAASRYVEGRADEAALLGSAKLRRRLTELGVELIGMGELAKGRGPAGRL